MFKPPWNEFYDKREKLLLISREEEHSRRSLRDVRHKSFQSHSSFPEGSVATANLQNCFNISVDFFKALAGSILTYPTFTHTHLFSTPI
jgi:hypothetical protein